MTSSNPYIRIHDGVLRRAAAQHRGAADYLQSVPASSHGQIEAFLSSLGPMFGDFRAAGMQTLEMRRQNYEDQAADHHQVSAGLETSADTWVAGESDAQQQFRGLTEA